MGIFTKKFTRTRDVQFSASCKLDVYTPNDNRVDRTVVVFFHGGGWRSGSKDSYPHPKIGQALAELGYVAVLPKYRLTREAQWPACYADAWNAAFWVLEHAKEYGGDSASVVLAGHSAGGHLATCVSLMSADVASRILACVGISGIYDLSACTEYTKKNIVTPQFGADKNKWRSASPIEYAPHAKCPFLVTIAAKDTDEMRSQGREFFKRIMATTCFNHRFLDLPKLGHLTEIKPRLFGPIPIIPVIDDFIRGVKK